MWFESAINLVSEAKIIMKNITFNGIDCIERLFMKTSKYLRKLDLSFISNLITDSQLRIIARNCTQLKSINLHLCNRITDTGILMLTQKCIYIEYLNLSACEQLLSIYIFMYLQQ